MTADEAHSLECAIASYALLNERAERKVDFLRRALVVARARIEHWSLDVEAGLLPTKESLSTARIQISTVLESISLSQETDR